MAEAAETRVVVAGASGYAGALAAELVWRHPKLELAYATSRNEAGKRLNELYPRYRAPIELTELNIQELEDVEAAIIGYPHAAAAPVVAEMRGMGLSVVDLSADFRLVDAAIYERWYAPHGEPELLDNAVYGLTELDRDRIRTADLVANPGCYPTAALLAILRRWPRSGVIASVVIDAKSGVSGAGRDGGERLSLVNLTENLMPYAVDGHRHLPEIEQELKRHGAQTAPITFIPHLLPIDQGLLASCYVDLTDPCRGHRRSVCRSLCGRPLRRGRRFAARASGRSRFEPLPDPRRALAENKVVVFAAIDNLWKGAAGQAIQNLNLMLGFDETDGLER